MEKTPKPQFLIKLINPGSKLHIPQAFTKHITKDNHGKATISILNKFWHVKVQEDEQGLHFGDGWQELTKALHLKDGYNVVFSYEGNMIFTLKVFDLSCCRKYDFPTNYNVSLKRRKTYQDNNDVQISDVDVASESVRPAFQREISQSSIVYSYLCIPSEFAALSGLLSSKQVTLKDQKGKLWSVNVHHSRGTSKFQKGWGKFIQENNVKSGDSCRFELISKENMMISVHITRAWNVSS